MTIQQRGERSTRWPLALTVLLTLFAQALTLRAKPVLILDWRPADLASIAMNYYRNGYDFLRPQILWGGNGPGYVETECPLIPYAIARLYGLFGVHDWLALAIPTLAGVGLAVVVHLFATHAFGRVAGLVAGALVATSPTWLDMSSGLWPDAPPVFLGTLGLYLLTLWVERKGTGRLLASATCVSLAILLKLTALYLGAPVLFLFWQQYRGAWWRAWTTWTFAAIALVPSLFWYAHAYNLFLEYGNTFGIIGAGYMKFGTFRLLTSPGFYARTAARIVLFHLTPIGALLVACGMASRVERPVDYLFPLWLGTVLAYLLVTATGVSLGHQQYALPIVPAAAILAGLGARTLVEFFKSSRASLVSCRTAMAGCLLLLAANAAASNVLYRTRGTGFSARSSQKMRTGRAVAAVSQPTDLILVVDADMDDRTPATSMTPPEVFYFSGRRGWYRAMEWLTAEAIEDLRTRGARYMAVSAPDTLYFRTAYAPLYEALARRYRTMQDDQTGIIYDLAASPAPAR